MDPTGHSLAMSPEWLDGSPFRNFLVPGVILLMVNGLGQPVGSLMSLKRARWHPEFAMAPGVSLMAWIVAQVYWLGYLHWLQPAYFGLGATELALGALIVKATRRQRVTGGLPD